MKENDYYGHYKAFVKRTQQQAGGRHSRSIAGRMEWCGADCMTGCAGITYPFKAISDVSLGTENSGPFDR